MHSSFSAFRLLATIAACLALVVIVLGAWVRLSAAGLGCPDWPGCYGHLTAEGAARNVDAISQAFPQRPFEYAKAAKEMVHRYFASALGLLIVVLAGIAIVNRKVPQQPVTLPVVLVGLVILQGLLGMWTVTLLLKPLIVVLHLLGGLATLSLLTWLAMKPPARSLRGHKVDEDAPDEPSSVAAAPSSSLLAAGPASRQKSGLIRKLAQFGLVVLVVQIALGGWTSSNYAALACPDFPTCQNAYWPDMDFKGAFVLWRGLGIDYEGGVLDHPARVAIHFTHRLGAVLSALMLGWLSVLAWRKGGSSRVRTAALAVGVVLIVQLVLGPLMVERAFPLSLATAHNAVAALLLVAIVRLNRLLVKP